MYCLSICNSSSCKNVRECLGWKSDCYRANKDFYTQNNLFIKSAQFLLRRLGFGENPRDLLQNHPQNQYYALGLPRVVKKLPTAEKVDTFEMYDSNS